MTKIFKNIREQVRQRPTGSIVFKKRIDRVSVTIRKDANVFVAYIDGDRLDAYKTQQEAEKMAKEFVKQYKG